MPLWKIFITEYECIHFLGISCENQLVFGELKVFICEWIRLRRNETKYSEFYGNSSWHMALAIHKVYIDGPYALLIRRSIDRLSAEQ